MRPFRVIPGLVIAALLVGCNSEPVAPTDDLATPSFGAAVKDQWVVPVWVDVTWYVECANDGAGENIDFLGWAYFNYSSITTNSGRYIEKMLITYDDAFGGVGQTSGDVWTVDTKKTTTIDSYVETNGDGWMANETLNEFYTNQDGETLHLRNIYHVVVAPDGSLKNFTLHGVCPGN